MGGQVGENPATLRAAVFSLSSKNLRGGGDVQTPPPPPPAGRGLSSLVKAPAFRSSPIQQHSRRTSSLVNG